MAVFTVIDHTELGASAVSFDVTSIPSSYDHLLIVASLRTDIANTLAINKLNFNGDTGSNYSDTQLQAATATVTSGQNLAGRTYMRVGQVSGASLLANSFGVLKIWIPNYANTANFKQALTQSNTGGDSTSDGWWSMNIDAGLWSSTAAIDQVTLATTPSAPEVGYVQYSTFTLYGITGA